jgi:outer membrane biogenesis lipoprotein LolB
MTRSKPLTALLLTGVATLVLTGCHTTVIEKQAPQQDHRDDHHDDHNQPPPPPPDHRDDHR